MAKCLAIEKRLHASSATGVTFGVLGPGFLLDTLCHGSETPNQRSLYILHGSSLHPG